MTHTEICCLGFTAEPQSLDGADSEVCTLDCGEVQIRSLAVFPDSCRLAVACDDGTLWSAIAPHAETSILDEQLSHG
eukprot:4261909-Amphidinium_carterae.1